MFFDRHHNTTAIPIATKDPEVTHHEADTIPRRPSTMTSHATRSTIYAMQVEGAVKASDIAWDDRWRSMPGDTDRGIRVIQEGNRPHHDGRDAINQLPFSTLYLSSAE